MLFGPVTLLAVNLIFQPVTAARGLFPITQVQLNGSIRFHLLLEIITAPPPPPFHFRHCSLPETSVNNLENSNAAAACS
ncbi:hypothetical protein TorRG33x02_069350 [Trema orientale]|uniref:Secreted protein n=1 Tax=Trema orientale TaxID=63057 RepID=A0A2P5FHB9_TREOI|nr:hypothetical protein TorRG33x02_069350 [Trema orientale]